MKQKKCRVCSEHFQPFNSLQKVCGPSCAVALVGIEKKKEFNKETRRLKEKIKKKDDYFKEALTACKRYVRARDRSCYLSQGRMPECCSCGTNKTDIQYAAGHYKTAGGHPELALIEFNIHLQCNRSCNCALSGNIEGTKTSAGYKVFMVGRYGQDYVDSLDGRPPKKYTISELAEIKKLYNYFANQLERDL